MTDVEVPIVLIVFNRPDLARGLVDALRPHRPKRLLVIADGPRESRPGEEALVAATRQEIARIDWPCEIARDYADANLGCGRRVASGLSWAFGEVERAIVLEDDVRPAPSFYPFAEELLARYAADERVFMISGFNPAERLVGLKASYAFTRFANCWGWASWARAWRHHGLDFPGWRSELDEAALAALLGNADAARVYARFFDRTATGKIDTWDFQWLYRMWRAGALSVVPLVNLVANVGFRGDATHTRASRYFGTMRTGELRFPLVHPSDIAADESVHRSMLIAHTQPRARSLARATARLAALLTPTPARRPA